MARRLATIVRGWGSSMVESLSPDVSESRVGMTCHGKVGVDKFIVLGEGERDECG
jgi:hypothetical protein